jgi:hypothetical protein
METSPAYEPNLIILKSLADVMKKAYDDDKKWSTIIDPEGNAEIFFKYQGTTLFSMSEKEMQPESLGNSLLKVCAFPRTVTINFLDLPYKNVFDEKYFPTALLDPNWILDYKNINKLRENFPQEFTEEFWACKDFRIVFFFRKNNVPAELWEKTKVFEVLKPEEFDEAVAAQKARIAEREKSKKPEEKKVDVKDAGKKTDSHTNSGDKKTTTSTSTSKPTNTATKTTTTATKSTPTVSKPTTVTKTTTTTATKTSTATSNTTKTVKK